MSLGIVIGSEVATIISQWVNTWVYQKLWDRDWAVVPFLGEDVDYKGPIYWSRDNGGYKNIILKGDAELINIEVNQLFDQNKYPQ